MSKPLSVFLFPHQDDEFGVFRIIEQNLQSGGRSICIFLTDGAANNASPSRRDGESLSVLKELGIPSEDVVFLPDVCRAPDGHLLEWMDRVFQSLVALLDGRNVDELYAPTWEGGHPDHDAAALIATALAERIGAGKIWYFSLYNSNAVKLLPFRVLSAVPRGQVTKDFQVSRRSAVRYIRLCMKYPSQWKTWVALLPFVAWRFLRHASQEIHALDAGFFRERPHSGPMLYERRGWMSWAQFREHAGAFIEENLEKNCAQRN